MNLDELNEIAARTLGSMKKIRNLQAQIDQEYAAMEEFSDGFDINLDDIYIELPKFQPELRISDSPLYEYSQASWTPDPDMKKMMENIVLTKIREGYQLYGIKLKNEREPYDMIIFRKRRR